jgi:hypothetical protein
LTFTGSVAGFAPGDYFDFKNINFADRPNVKYNQNTGQLTVTDPHIKVVGTIILVGDYKNSEFVASSDGHGGTLLTDPKLSALMTEFADAQQNGAGTVIAHDAYDTVTTHNESIAQLHNGHILLV